jgi:hypothetical protein
MKFVVQLVMMVLVRIMLTKLKSTSYQDNSDIVQLGFLSRILNEGVRQRMIPIIYWRK